MLKKEKVQVSEFIKRMRKLSGLTQNQLADLMGTTQCKISHVECNKDVTLTDYLNVIEALIKSSAKHTTNTRPYRGV